MTISHAVTVRRAGTYPAALAILVGAALLVVGALGWGRRRSTARR